jgi:acetolactate synthase-1/2/3 large subunit
VKGKQAIAKILKKVIKPRTERVGINIIDGFTRASFGQRNGVCMTQWGPGAENSFVGVAHAFGDSVPILLLPAGYERRMLYRPQFSAKLSYREITKWVDTVIFADRIPEMMRNAFTYVRNGRPGPVMLEIPSDVGEEEFDDALFQYQPVKKYRSAGDPNDVKAVAKALIAAKNPVIRAGQGVLYAEAWDELRELAELLQIPVYTTMNGKSCFPENHPLSLGAGGKARTKMVMHFQAKADLVFAIGSSCTKEEYTVPIPDGTVILQSTVDEVDISKNYLIEHAIIGDAKLVLRQLVDEAKAQVGTAGIKENVGLIKEITAVKEEWLKEWMPKLASDETPINPYRLVWDIARALDEKSTIITHDSGSPRDQLTPFYESNTPGGYIGWGKTTTLGQGLGLAMGAKLARPEKTCVHYMGDAAFGMVGMDFETAARERIPIISIMTKNSVMQGYGKIYPKAIELYNLDALTGDYSKIAEGCGGYAERVEKPEDIIPAIRRAKKANETGKPALVEVITRVETARSEG